jgi:two-component system sensor histidine kinase TctE
VFYDARLSTGEGETAVRVAAIQLPWGEPDQPQTMLVQVARSRISQALLARQILADTVLPLSLLVLAMSALVWVGIRTGLAPLARLREAVSGRAPNDLAPIELRSAPSEVRDLAAALNTLLAAVHENVVKQRRFISDAAHQLRTPLAGLKGQAELALREATDPALRARLERVAQSATRSAHLITQLLTLARAEPESAAAQGRSHFDLRRLVQELTAEQVPRALAQGVDLGLDEDGEQEAATPVGVEGNALLIREALVNLIDNAIRYAGRDAVVTLRVRLLPAPAHAPAWAEVDVDDNGPGLPPELHQQVFDRFVRVANDGNGCGLGLAIVQEIAARVTKSVDVADSKSAAARRASSSLAAGTSLLLAYALSFPRRQWDLVGFLPMALMMIPGEIFNTLGLVLFFLLLTNRQMVPIAPIMVSAKTMVLIFGGMELVQGVLFSHSGIAHFAHLGGMLGGWLMLRFWQGRPPFPPRLRRL